MRISAKPLKNYQNVNSFQQTTEWTIRKGEPNRLYLQLVDAEQDGLRYLPTDLSYSVSMTFPALNASNVIVKSAAQASALDNSIWYVDLSSTDNAFTGSVQISVTEGSVVRNFSLTSSLNVELLSNGGC